MEPNVKTLVENIPRWIDAFNKHGYRGGPSLYFYQRVMSRRKAKSINELLNKGENFIELMYATMGCWDMNTRRAKMKDFDVFENNLVNIKELCKNLSGYSLDNILEENMATVKKSLGNLYDELDFMISKARLVANSKILHFVLPDLVMPMDRNTLAFFFSNSTESKNKFLKIFECTCEVAREIDLKTYLDQNWNLSITKVIDNAIIGSRQVARNGSS